MASCANCIHHSLCDYNTNISGNGKIRLVYAEGADVKCSFFQNAADVAQKSEVETELPCVAYNKKHERYQVIHKGKQGHIFASKLYRNRREAEDALAELKKKYTEEKT